MKLDQFVKTLESIRKALGGDYAPQQVSILLLAKLRPGITHKELGQILSMPQGTVSRNCKALGRYMRKGQGEVIKEAGHGLVVNRPDELFDRRRNAVYLTEKGKRFVQTIQQLIHESKAELIPQNSEKELD